VKGLYRADVRGTGIVPVPLLQVLQAMELQAGSFKERVPRRSPPGGKEIAVYERRKQALRMRREGASFESIADSLGYYDASHASRDYHVALEAIPAPEVEEIRRQEGDNKKFLYERQLQVVLHPPLQHSAIGKPIPDPVNPGEFLVNESVRNQAIRNANTISDSYCRLMGVPLNAEAQGVSEAAVREMQEALGYLPQVIAEREQLRARVWELEAQIAGWESGQITDAVVVG
jgi:hypothetical protein